MKIIGCAKGNLTEGQLLTVRKALPEDAFDVLCWRNDPVVCAMSRRHEPIDKITHMAWYSKAINDPNRLFLIGVLEDKGIGFVRFDHLQDSMWEVNITVASDLRGKGLGKHFLRMALDQLHIAFGSASVKAMVRINNQGSQNLFYALGFVQKATEGEFVSLVLT